MLSTRHVTSAVAVVVIPLLIAACTDDGNDGEDNTRTVGATVTRANGTDTSTAAGGTTPTADLAKPEATLAVATAPPRDQGAAFSIEDATAMLDAVLLKPADLPAGWIVQSDSSQDNAAAAQMRPESAASNERCGRLLSRTITNFPPDSISAFLAGTALAFFSTATVYETPEGAADCAAENAIRLAEPGALAREFGNVFIDPDAVIVEPVEFPAVADGAFAANLTGKINAQGTEIDLTILVVALARGNTTAAVGSAYSGADPPVEELRPYVEAVVARIDAWQ
jgi:hypothetical protein